jgi:hypothetical protein
LVNPLTVVLVAAGFPVTVTGDCAVEPMNGVTVYVVIVLPPVFDGPVQLTVAEALPPLAVTPVGAPGTVGPLGVTTLDGDDSGPAPLALVAVTVKV